MSSIYREKSWTWWLFLLVYGGLFAFDLYQNRHVPWSYKLELPFFLTYVGAFHVMLRHLFHFDGPVGQAIKPLFLSGVNPHHMVPYSWRRLAHTFFYQQIFAVELTIVSCYWLLLSHFFVTTGSIVVMHGIFALVLYGDFILTRVTFHLRHNMICSCIYALMYMVISWTGQLIFSRPVYPMSDWNHHFIKALLVMGILWAVTMLANIVAFYLSKMIRLLVSS